MGSSVQAWRRRHRLTQVEAAKLLGVSQPYLSLLENAARPLTPELRERLRSGDSNDEDRFRAALGALGYPGFAHVARDRSRVRPGALLLDVLTLADVDARVVEGLPWLLRRLGAELKWPELVKRAKLENTQNRLGFLLALAGPATPEAQSALAELDRARLLREDTLCWESMPVATRDWMRAQRSPLAAHWNVLTRLSADDLAQWDVPHVA